MHQAAVLVVVVAPLAVVGNLEQEHGRLQVAPTEEDHKVVAAGAGPAGRGAADGKSVHLPHIVDRASTVVHRDQVLVHEVEKEAGAEGAGSD